MLIRYAKCVQIERNLIEVSCFPRISRKCILTPMIITLPFKILLSIDFFVWFFFSLSLHTHSTCCIDHLRINTLRYEKKMKKQKTKNKTIQNETKNTRNPFAQIINSIWDSRNRHHCFEQFFFRWNRRPQSKHYRTDNANTRAKPNGRNETQK